MLDDILLGYKAEWPMNIVITVDALKIYAEIFCYLLQVRFAVFSLTEVWRFLKVPFQHFIHLGAHAMRTSISVIVMWTEPVLLVPNVHRKYHCD